MRFRGAGLLSRLPTGEGCRDDWLLAQREWRVTRVLLEEDSTSLGASATGVGRELEPLLAAFREWGLLVGDCGREEAALGSLVRFQEDSWSPLVWRTGAGIEVWRDVLAAWLGDSESEIRPPPRRAFVIALSFIGLSTSSSELSAIVGWDEGWPRCASRADVRLPIGGYRLPASSGVRDILRVGRWCQTPCRVASDAWEGPSLVWIRQMSKNVEASTVAKVCGCKSCDLLFSF